MNLVNWLFNLIRSKISLSGKTNVTKLINPKIPGARKLLYSKWNGEKIILRKNKIIKIFIRLISGGGSWSFRIELIYDPKNEKKRRWFSNNEK